MSRKDRLRRLVELYSHAERVGAGSGVLSRMRNEIIAQQQRERERLAAECADRREQATGESVNTRRGSFREWVSRWIDSSVGAAPALPFHAPQSFVRAAVDQVSRQMRDRATLPPEARATADALDALERRERQRVEVEALTRDFLDSVEALGEPSTEEEPAAEPAPRDEPDAGVTERSTTVFGERHPLRVEPPVTIDTSPFREVATAARERWSMVRDARVREGHREPERSPPADSVDAQAGQWTPLTFPEPSYPDHVRSVLAQAREFGLSEAEIRRLTEAIPAFNRSLAQQREEWEGMRAAVEEHAAALESLAEARSRDRWQPSERVVQLVERVAELADGLSGDVDLVPLDLTAAGVAALAQEIEQAARSLRVELEGSPEPKPKPRTLPEGPISSERFRGLLDEREEDA